MTPPVNITGRDLIVQYEGIRLKAYDDVAGKKTIGIGHLITPGDNIGDEITQEQCETLFEKDLSHAALSIDQLITAPLTDNQRGALLSFAFNLGHDALKRSTLRTKLNAGDYSGAAEEFRKWIYAGTDISTGLMHRREAERALFLTPDEEPVTHNID